MTFPKAPGADTDISPSSLHRCVSNEGSVGMTTAESTLLSSPEDVDCPHIAGVTSGKVTLIEHVHLAQAILPHVLEMAIGEGDDVPSPRGRDLRPTGLVEENRYLVSEDATTLSDLVLCSGGRTVAFVSPLADPVEHLASIRSSVWTCEFLVEEDHGHAGPGQGGAAAIEGRCALATDELHSFRVTCPVDPIPMSCLQSAHHRIDCARTECWACALAIIISPRSLPPGGAALLKSRH